MKTPVRKFRADLHTITVDTTKSLYILCEGANIMKVGQVRGLLPQRFISSFPAN